MSKCSKRSAGRTSPLYINPDDLVGTAAALRARAGFHRPPYSTRGIIRACAPQVEVTGNPEIQRHGANEATLITNQGPVILYARQLTPPEQRFHIAHGFGHVLFDKPEHACRPGFAGDP